MDTTRTKTIERQTNADSLENFDRDSQLTQKGLDLLLAENAKFEREKEIFNSEKEKLEADLMEHPLTSEKVFGYFGLLLGTFPPAAFFARIIFQPGVFRAEDFLFLILFILVNAATATAGYFSGKVIGRFMDELEKQPWWVLAFLLPMIGLLWGILSGGIGGIFAFILGAVVGAIIGGIVGFIGLPLFTIFHIIFKRGDKMDRKHFLPIAFGIVFVISAFILGI